MATSIGRKDATIIKLLSSGSGAFILRMAKPTDPAMASESSAGTTINGVHPGRIAASTPGTNNAGPAVSHNAISERFC